MAPEDDDAVIVGTFPRSEAVSAPAGWKLPASRKYGESSAKGADIGIPDAPGHMPRIIYISRFILQHLFDTALFLSSHPSHNVIGWW